MADRRIKIVLASALLVSAVGGSFMFLRPTGTQQASTTAAAPAADLGASLRHRIDDPVPVAGFSHLLGRIEPDPAAAPQPTKPLAVAPVKPATNRQSFEVGELPAPSSSWQGMGSAGPQTAWSPLHDRMNRPLVHRVREGDTLSSLARQYLGSSERFSELFSANQRVLADPNHLRVGMELVIPQSPTSADYVPADTVPADLYRPASTSQASEARANPPAAMVPISPGSWRRSRSTESPARSYRVRAEDTLVDIAKQFYGDGSKFQDLYEANRDQLASPDQLREGLLLVIP